MFEFDVTDSMLLGCVTVLLHVLLLLFTFSLFTFKKIIFCVFMFYGLMPEIKMDWIDAVPINLFNN